MISKTIGSLGFSLFSDTPKCSLTLKGTIQAMVSCRFSQQNQSIESTKAKKLRPVLQSSLSSWTRDQRHREEVANLLGTLAGSAWLIWFFRLSTDGCGSFGWGFKILIETRVSIYDSNIWCFGHFGRVFFLTQFENPLLDNWDVCNPEMLIEWRYQSIHSGKLVKLT